MRLLCLKMSKEAVKKKINEVKVKRLKKMMQNGNNKVLLSVIYRINEYDFPSLFSFNFLFLYLLRSRCLFLNEIYQVYCTVYPTP